MRQATIQRKTLETDIDLALNLDGDGTCTLTTGIGFFDHMLSALCRFGQLSLSGTCRGDLAVDGHHTVEDMGICMGKALGDALGDRQGIRRLGQAVVPMDESLATCYLDISARPYLVFHGTFSAPMVGDFDTQLVCEFFRALATHGGLTLHLAVVYGQNDHHKIEAMFKAFGRALDEGKAQDPRLSGPLSTKGVLG